MPDVLRRLRGAIFGVLLALIVIPTWGATEKPGAEASNESATVRVFNRDIVTFRGPFLGQSPATRAARSKSALNEQLRQSNEQTVTVKDNPVGKMVMLGPHLVFVITTEDVDVLTGETLDEKAIVASAEKPSANSGSNDIELLTT